MTQTRNFQKTVEKLVGHFMDFDHLVGKKFCSKKHDFAFAGVFISNW